MTPSKFVTPFISEEFHRLISKSPDFCPKPKPPQPCKKFNWFKTFLLCAFIAGVVFSLFGDCGYAKLLRGPRGPPGAQGPLGPQGRPGNPFPVTSSFRSSPRYFTAVGNKELGTTDLVLSNPLYISPTYSHTTPGSFFIDSAGLYTVTLSCTETSQLSILADGVIVSSSGAVNTLSGVVSVSPGASKEITLTSDVEDNVCSIVALSFFG